MENNFDELNKKEKRELRRQERNKEKTVGGQIKRIKKIAKISIWVLIIIVAAGLIWFVSKNSGSERTLDENIITRQGLHWHYNLEIFIKGEKQEIPAEIGIGFTHQPTHTHDATGQIHLEFSGLVKKDDVKLGKFFEVWGKQFNSNCIFDKCNGADGKVKFLVNKEENNEFENYIVKDGDDIEIKFE